MDAEFKMGCGKDNIYQAIAWTKSLLKYDINVCKFADIKCTWDKWECEHLKTENLEKTRDFVNLLEYIFVCAVLSDSVAFII